MATKSRDFKPLIYIRGCGCLFLFKISMKNGLDAARMTLWASTRLPSSQTRVTSRRSLSSLSFPKDEFTPALKSFHCRQSFSEVFMISTEQGWDGIHYTVRTKLNIFSGPKRNFNEQEVWVKSLYCTGQTGRPKLTYQLGCPTIHIFLN